MPNDDDAQKVCPRCNGERHVECYLCKGAGQVDDPANPGGYVPCPNGTNGRMTCPMCQGSGWKPGS